jgi:hypothetical protein
VNFRQATTPKKYPEETRKENLNLYRSLATIFYNNKSSLPPEFELPKEPKALAPAPAPPAGFGPPHNPDIAFSLSRSFIDFPAPVFAAVAEGFAAPGPRDIDHRSSKLVPGAAVDFVCVLGTVLRRFDVVEEVGLMGATPPKRFGGCAWV